MIAQQGRLRWMDLMRGAAILLVILHHSIEIPRMLDADIPAVLQTLDAVFAPFRMPLLMFLSGMLLPRSFRRSTRDYFLGKARGILWPYAVWSIIVLAILGQLTVSILLNVLVYPPTYLWYLWFLFAFYTVAWVLQRLHVPPLAASIAVLVVSVFLPDDYRLSRFAFLMAFFLAGWWWAQNDRRSVSPRVRVVVVAVALGLAVLASVLAATGVASRYEATFAWGSVALIVAIVLGVPSTAQRRWALPLEYVGRNSIVFYVSHYPVIFAVVVWLLPAFQTGTLWLLAMTAMVVAIAAGILLTMGRDRLPALRWLFEWPARSIARPVR